MVLTKANTATKAKVTAAPGKTVKRLAKPKAGGKPAPAAAAKKKDDALAARAADHEQTRRENALAKIRTAAETAGVQKARIGIFMDRLKARMDRSVERVQQLVAKERARQAAALDKHPEFKQLNGKPELDAAAKIPDVEIPESELPSYITNIKLETE